MSLYVLKTWKYAKMSYSQCGEDLIISHIFKSLKKPLINYIDIGAHHPFKFSNTAYFYKIGSRGINIEPNKEQYKLLIRFRKNDLNLNVGIDIQNGYKEYYMFEESTLNTFDKDYANELIKKWSKKLIKTDKVKNITVKYLIDNYIKDREIEFINIDAEGVDFLVISNLLKHKIYPKVFCIETITYSENGSGRKNDIIVNLLTSNGYMIYADTYINTIFVYQDIWLNRN